MFSFVSKNVQRHTDAESKEIGFTRYGEVPVIGLLVGIAGGILSLIVLFALIPVIGASVDQAMPKTVVDNPAYDQDAYDDVEEAAVDGTFGLDDKYGYWYKSGGATIFQYIDSAWSGSDIPTGVGLWTTIGPLLVLCALVAVVMIVLKLIGVF